VIEEQLSPYRCTGASMREHARYPCHWRERPVRAALAAVRRPTGGPPRASFLRPSRRRGCWVLASPERGNDGFAAMLLAPRRPAHGDQQEIVDTGGPAVCIMDAAIPKTPECSGGGTLVDGPCHGPMPRGT
jgi:hypothetical protein